MFDSIENVHVKSCSTLLLLLLLSIPSCEGLAVARPNADISKDLLWSKFNGGDVGGLIGNFLLNFLAEIQC
jgi:hypothetical protein